MVFQLRQQLIRHQLLVKLELGLKPFIQESIIEQQHLLVHQLMDQPRQFGRQPLWQELLRWRRQEFVLLWFKQQLDLQVQQLLKLISLALDRLVGILEFLERH